MATKPNLSFRVEPELYDKLRRLADQTGQRESDLLRDAITRYLDSPPSTDTVEGRLQSLERQVALIRKKTRI